MTYVDEFVDGLLTKGRVCATTLPKVNPRAFLEDEGKLEERVSALGEELDELDAESGSDGEDAVEEVGRVRVDGGGLNGGEGEVVSRYLEEVGKGGPLRLRGKSRRTTSFLIRYIFGFKSTRPTALSLRTAATPRPSSR